MIILRFICLGLALAVCSRISIAAAQERPALRVVALTSKTEVRFEEYFKLAFRIENVSASNQIVRVTRCGSYNNEWQISNSNLIHWEVACFENGDNGPEEVSIPSGSAYTNELELVNLAEFPTQTLKFRAGFTSIGSTETFWSDEIALKIVPPGVIRSGDVIAGQKGSEFRVVALPSKSEVRADESFKLALRVENTSTSNQTVRVMSCSWLNEWESSNTNVSPVPWACTRNVPENVSISPGAAYTNECEMEVRPSFSGQALSFRMGFTAINGSRTFWSDKVNLKILPHGSQQVDR